MRYPAGQKDVTRKRLLRAAGRSFRQHGYGGIGVDGLAKAAGLTSGAFYSHFTSKTDAFRAVVAAGLSQLRGGIEAVQSTAKADWVTALTAFYLSPTHRHNIADSCALPSLSAEVARAEEPVRGAYQEELVKVVDVFAAGLPEAQDQRQTAIAALAMLAGGVTLARAVRDETVAQQIADAVQRAVLTLTAAPPVR